MKKNIIIITASLLSFFFDANSQITTGTLTPTQYVQNVLLGGGVTASNITYTGLSEMISTFSATPIGNLGLSNGVYLTCGSNGTIPGELGPNGPSSGFQSVNQFQPGDADLDVVSGFSTFDASILEFDFIPQSDTVRFRYVFGSEEYNDYVNSGVNDAFAFLLSGVTTPLAQTNIALIPGTTTPISINTVNNGNSFGVSNGPCSNCAYYRDNILGGINCVYDGLTTVLTAKAKVICGEKYHIKIAIADAGDHVFDSGVFLEAGSFSSAPPLNVYTINSNSNIPDSVLVEDCNTYCAYFIRNGNISVVDSFNLQVTGNALLGPDYFQTGNPGFSWPTKLIFAANQDTIKICNINALQDNLIEGTDTIKFEMSSFVTNTLSCLSTNSIKFNLYIEDYVPIGIGQNSTSVCTGNSILLNAGATNGYPPYTYTWTSPPVNTATLNTGPINSPTNFTITVNDICNKPTTQTIIINPVSTPTIVSSNTLICIGTTASLTASGATTYTWSNGVANDTLFVSPNVNTTYTVIGANGACTNSAVSTVSVVGIALSVTGNNSICLGQNTTLTALGSTSYTWNTGSNSSAINVSPTITTNYTVSSIAASCSNTAVYTVSVTPPPTLTVTGTPYCAGQTTTVTASGANSYTWSTGATTNSIVVSPLVNSTYTLIGSSLPSCTSAVVFTPSLITTAPQIINTSPVIFCLDSIKAITVRIDGGNQPYTISWLIPGGGIVPFDTTNYTFYFTQSLTPSNGSYTIVVTDQCLYTDTLAIDINSIDCNILAPNVVTPNGDGINDFFRINGLENFPGSSLSVFSRWGNKLYTSDDYKNNWSPNVIDGTYFYVLNVSDGRKLNGFFHVFKD
jgi:gliding motility-associated-like protein